LLVVPPTTETPTESGFDEFVGDVGDVGGDKSTTNSHQQSRDAEAVKCDVLVAPPTVKTPRETGFEKSVGDVGDEKATMSSHTNGGQATPSGEHRPPTNTNITNKNLETPVHKGIDPVGGTTNRPPTTTNNHQHHQQTRESETLFERIRSGG